ncbi:alpha/beta fold hydrolase [Nocardia sp. NPDC024068]|uniref:alpha/beta hydrolase family protein n=1 Tax=Nocardia sp. NPDC024068 TaxID=3157197 RepID=UPI0033DAA2DF
MDIEADTAVTAQWRAPDYADPATFHEREVTVTAGRHTVAGTATLPRTRGPHPGVVLLAGGGPFDRDGTAGPNKNLKDLAWGLAGHGVAVLRFDKVTYTHRELLTAATGFTPTAEYVPHAVVATQLLRELPGVDADRIVVLGHSMGGRFAPRVAAAEPGIAGVVILAGDTVPLHWSLVRAIRHLAETDPATAALLPTIEVATAQATLVDDPGLAAGTPAEQLPFGMSGTYWLDLRAYDPVATAASLDIPMLILQGERDYQVTVEDDLAGWRAGLAGRRDVTFRTYPADDHMFFPGTGPSTPSDYTRSHHVDPEVVGDIAEWLTGLGR